jgi:uncharacterized protein
VGGVGQNTGAAVAPGTPIEPAVCHRNVPDPKSLSETCAVGTTATWRPEPVIKRRQILQRAAAGLAALPVLATTQSFAATQSGTGSAKQDKAGDAQLSPTERNKRAVRAHYERLQHYSVPPTLPGEQEPTSLSYGGTSAFITNYDPPDGVAGWQAQSKGPSLVSYGPMIAEGDFVVEEWESYFFGLDRTMYNNHYCWIKQVKNDEVVLTREYVDSHHVYTVFHSYGEGKEAGPLRTPRRRGQPGNKSKDTSPLTEMETVFPIRQEFNLPPAMLRDVTPTANGKRFPDTIEGNKALVQAMREAQAKGDAAGVDSLHGKGFRHFVAGEGPLGWEHLPFEELYAPLVKHLTSPLKVRLGPMVAEGGSVFEEMDTLATLDDGTVYNNWHCFIHEIRNGQIVQTREYMDTHHLWVMLGRWAEWGKTPVPPLRQARRSNLPYVTATFQTRNPFLKLARWEPLPPLKA